MLLFSYYLFSSTYEQSNFLTYVLIYNIILYLMM